MKAPRKPGALPSSDGWRLGRDFGADLPGLALDHLAIRGDRDGARFLRLGNLAHEIDVQETMLEGRTLDLDEVGELEDALKGAGGNALIKRLAGLLVRLVLLLTANGE